MAPRDVARHLAAAGIFVADGDFYAMELHAALGLTEGTVRAGFLHYNTAAEGDRLADALATLS
jgi:selenocysteine lyase/cysteine desulfurase